MGSETGKDTRMEMEGESFVIRHIRKETEQINPALPFRTWHHLCRQEVAPAGSQQVWAQDPAPARRCCTERSTGHRVREGKNGDGDGGENGNDNEEGNPYKCRDRDKDGRGNGDENRDEGRGEREPGNQRSGSRGRCEDMRASAMPRRNQQPQPQIPTPERDVASCGKPEPKEGRQGTGSRKAEERRRKARNPKRVVDPMWKMGDTRTEGEENVDIKVSIHSSVDVNPE